MNPAPDRVETSPESLKAILEGEYKELLSTYINPSNLYTFFDEAVEKLVEIIKKTITEYLALNPTEKAVGKELEDKALDHFGLLSVNETLDVIAQKRKSIQGMEDEIARATGLSNDVFVPPTPDDKYIVGGSGRGIEEKRLIPRLVTLVYILQNDLNLYLSDDEEGISITRGEITDEMVRKQPYFRVTIPSLNRTVYICDEEGNASFIFSTEKVLERVSSIQKLDTTDKATYKEIIDEYPGMGRVVRHVPLWREQMISALTNEFEQVKQTRKYNPRSDFEMPKDIPPKKEGWETATSLMLSQRVKPKVPAIKEYAESFREAHPEWFEVQTSKSNKPAERYHPDLVKEIETHFKEIEPKEDWKHARDLIPLLDLHRKTIANSAEQYRAEHPEWFETKRNAKGTFSEYYHPDLIKNLQEQWRSVPDKKEGWETANKLSGILNNNTHHRAIKAFAESYRTEHPEWFEVQKQRTNLTEHYHPELVKIITDYFNKIPLKKEGWRSLSSLTSQTKRHRKTINSLAEKYRMSHPEWFEVQKVGPQTVEHYHPDLVTKIMEHLLSVPTKKEGWETAAKLYLPLHTDFSTVKTFAETFRTQHPEWFEIQLTGSQMAEHYHPDLVAKLREHFSAIPQRRENWESPSILSKEFNIGSDKVILEAEQYRAEHPEWFEVQRNHGKTVEYYHPELVNKIKNTLKMMAHKEGWKSNRTLHLDAVVPLTIKNYAETFRAQHPEWFEVQRKGGSLYEFYHPLLVEKIKDHFSQYPQRKEGWLNARAIADDVRRDSNNIKRYAESFKPEHPEWFEIQKWKNSVTEHYHPLLVEKILKHFTSFPLEKEGWHNSFQLSSLLQAAKETVQDTAEQYRAEHPEWFEMQRNNKGVSTEHFHPDLIKEIAKKLLVPEKKPGWEGAVTLASLLNYDFYTIKEYAETFRAQHPEWFEKQRNVTRTAEYYHPDLVNKIREHFKSN